MSLRPGAKAEERRNRYKVAVDAEEGRRRREDNMVEIRKNKREESLLKKRREGQQQQQLSASLQSSALEKKMGRVKLRMELISDEKQRRLTFEKRRKGLEKKANELSTLCGVDLCMIIYGQNSDVPVIWNHDKVSSMILSYNSKSDYDCRYKTYGLSSFFKDETQRVGKEVEKVRDEIRELVKYPTKLDERWYNCMSSEELKEFANCALSNKIHLVKERINLMKKNKIGIPSVQQNALMNSMPFINDDQEPNNMIYYDEGQSLLLSNNNNMNFIQRMLMNEGACRQRQNENYNANFPLSYSDNICDENQIQNFGFGKLMDYYGLTAGDEKMVMSENGSLWMQPSNFFPQTHQMWDAAQGADYNFGYLQDFDQMMNNYI